MPTRVFLLRHAESADPTVFHGAESDTDLSEKGRRQAEALVEVLKPRRPDVIVTSNMRRTRATAAPLALACELQLQIEPDFHERKMGILSGIPFKSDTVWPETLRRWKAGETGYAHEGAESFDDIRNRVLPIWERVIRQHEGRTLVMVLHGVVVKVLLLSLLEGWGPKDWERLGPSHNVSITELERDGDGWRALSLNRQPEAIRMRGLS